MLEFVQITAQYSNAVLVAILPHISAFSEKLSLSATPPVIPAYVADFKCDPRKDKIGGLVTLTNGSKFTFLDGRVCVYRSPQSFFSLQDPDRIPEFYGPVRVKKKEALRIAHAAIKRLGYTDATFHADRAPETTEPERINTNYIPRYRFRWLDPEKHPENRGSNILPVLLDIEVDASNGRIQMLSLTGANTYRPGPKVDVSPPLLRRQDQRATNDLSGGIHTRAVSPGYAAAFLEAILPQLSAFASAIKLPAPLPVRTNQLDLSRYTCRELDGQPMAQVYLTNGDRFNYQHGHVAAFYAHDAYRKFPDSGRLQDFLGKINMTTNQAIKLCEDTLRTLGYKPKLPKAWFGGRAFIGDKEFSRYVFYWRKPGTMSEFASVEVDVETRMIKSLFLDDPSLWREPPKIDAPMLPTASPANQ